MVWVVTSTPGELPELVRDAPAAEDPDPELAHAATRVAKARADTPPSVLRAIVFFIFPQPV
jgi:hypothetical protein